MLLLLLLLRLLWLRFWLLLLLWSLHFRFTNFYQIFDFEINKQNLWKEKPKFKQVWNEILRKLCCVLVFVVAIYLQVLDMIRFIGSHTHTRTHTIFVRCLSMEKGKSENWKLPLNGKYEEKVAKQKNTNKKHVCC